ncbi:MAG: 2Fe-2S iron-sulfur cluster-binding protein [Mycobacterium sp.]
MSISTRTLTVAQVIRETPEAVTIVFDSDLNDSYRPGQFLTLRLPSAQTGSVARCYSLSSSPAIDERWAITVKRTAGGYASNWLCDNVNPGDRIESLLPGGMFTPADVTADFLLIAGGSGITPMMSIIKTVMASRRGRAALIYANRDADAVIFAAHLRALVQEHPERLSVVHWLESVQGRPSGPALRTLIAPYRDREVFLCGPTAFMECALSALTATGVKRSSIHVEKFVSLTGDPFTIDTSATHSSNGDAASHADGQRSAEVVVNLEGARHSLEWPRHQTLIDVLESHGIEAPYSCRVGDCGTCQCVLVSGRVHMDSHFALEEADIAEGLVLACQARPASDRIEIEFEF